MNYDEDDANVIRADLVSALCFYALSAPFFN